jgi:NCAIR mutase (PurE)-related protein
MTDDTDLETLLSRVASGDVSVAAAAEELREIGRVGEIARVDTRQAARTGIPEVVEAERKDEEALLGITRELLDGTGRAILTGLADDTRDRIGNLDAVASEEWYARSGTLVMYTSDFEPPSNDGTVGVVTAGTSDIPVAEQAVALATEMGCDVESVYDVGVSGIRRLVDELETLDACDVLVVAAGREGALATVVAGLVDVPVIGLPVGTGTGLGGEGEAALLGMLQSCTYLTTVNVDAGFVAGGQAALIARGKTE